MQSVVCAALLIVAASAHEAFVPPTTPLRGLTKTVAPRTAPQMVAEDVPAFARDDAGITAPLGYWDPIGLAKDEETFNFYRRAELKHGRVAMLAMIGYAVPYFFKFDGWLATNPELKFADIPPGIDAVRAISAAGIAQLMFFIAFLDNIVFPVDSKYVRQGQDSPHSQPDSSHRGTALVGVLCAGNRCRPWLLVEGP